MRKLKQVGIIVGRFQVANLHEGHQFLIETVMNNSDHTIIFLGVSPNQYTIKDPLPYLLRKHMILEQYPGVQIEPLRDIPESDHDWVKQLEAAINTYVKKDEKAWLYGSRESFINTYMNAGGTIQNIGVITAKGTFNGTEERTKIKNTLLNSEDYRKGIIHACLNKPNNEI